MTHEILAGHTLTLAMGTYRFGGVLAIDGSPGAGTPGGALIIGQAADSANSGTIFVDGGYPTYEGNHETGGGTLELLGTMTNTGGIEVAGGDIWSSGAVGDGGYMLDAGLLVNKGSVLVGAGVPLATGEIQGQGGEMVVTGVLVNDGAMTIEGSRYDRTDGFYALSVGSVVNWGSIANAGTITIDGGGVSGIAGFWGGSGGSLVGRGTLTNSGVMVLEGGVGATVKTAHGGGGAMAGFDVLFNQGTIDIEGGEAGVKTLKVGDYGFGYGFGASLGVGYTFANSGLIVVGAGEPAPVAGGMSGMGGELGLDSGALRFSNSGTILVDGGAGSTVPEANELYGGSFFLGGYHDVNSGLIYLEGAGTNEYHGGEMTLGGVVDENTTLVNTGTIEIGSATGVNGAAGQLWIDPGSVLDMTGGSLVQMGGGYYPVMIFNEGTIEGFGTIDMNSVGGGGVSAASGGLLRVSANFVVNDESFRVDAGATLALYGTVEKSDSFSIAAGGTLITVAGNVGSRINSTHGGTLTIAGGGVTTLNANDTDLTVTLAKPTVLSLSQQGFLTVDGGNGGDRIYAEAAGQTLIGGTGDFLMGSSAEGDVFQGTAAALDLNEIGNFAGTDVIDVTDLAPGSGLVLDYVQKSDKGTLTLSEGKVTTHIVLEGSFTQGQFTTSSDGAGGVLVHV